MGNTNTKSVAGKAPVKTAPVEREKPVEAKKSPCQQLVDRTKVMLEKQLPWFLPTAGALATYALPPHISTPLLGLAWLATFSNRVRYDHRSCNKFQDLFKGIIPMLLLKAGIATFAPPATSSVLDFMFTKTVGSPYAQGAAYGASALAFIYRFNKISHRWSH